jgi:hypothetical protein
MPGIGGRHDRNTQLREDVRIEGTEHLELQHLYRAMDFL